MALTSTSLLQIQTYMPKVSPSAEMVGEGFWIGLYEPERFMHIIPQGVWSIDQTVAYRRVLRAATGRMVRSGGYKGAVFDASVYPEQDIEVMRHHSAAMRMARWIFNVKASVYLPHDVTGSQLEAVTIQGHQRIFSNSADTMDWLLA